MKILCDAANCIIEKLTDAGFEAYAVGGCVRDMIMGIPADDYDITTNATTEEIKKVFKDNRIIETGIKHGTVTVMIDNTGYEITTYRLESTYSDNRHPDKVIFTRKLSDDLSRRDFTINSIAFNETEGFVDLYGGREDIEKKLIRCVGIPDERFGEDALRILRALRFSSVLGFDIEKETRASIIRNRKLIKNISKERVFTELSKLICGKDVRRVITDFSSVLGEIIPEINDMRGFEQHNFHHVHDVLTHTAVVTQSIAPVLHLRLAALLHDAAKPGCFSLDENGTGHFYSHATKGTEIADRVLTDLKCDNKTKDSVLRLIKAHDAPIEESERIIKRRLGSMGQELFFDLIRLKRADTAGLAPELSERNAHFDRLEEIAHKILEKEECFSLKSLAVKGDDIIKLGFSGKEIGKVLNALLEAVIDNKTDNEKEKLIEYAVENFVNG